MPSTGFTAFQSGLNVDRDNGQLWTNPSNALTDDTDLASSGAKASLGSDWLRFENPGFSIPAGSRIDGVEFRLRRYEDGAGAAEDSELHLRTSAGRVGDNQAVAGDWEGTATAVTYGGAADLMGTVLTVADVNASTFGFDVSCDESGGSGKNAAKVEFGEINVHFTNPIETDTDKFALIGLHMPWEDSNLPISPGTLGADDKVQLLHEYPGLFPGGAAPGTLPLLGVGK